MPIQINPCYAGSVGRYLGPNYKLENHQKIAIFKPLDTDWTAVGGWVESPIFVSIFVGNIGSENFARPVRIGVQDLAISADYDRQASKFGA